MCSFGGSMKNETINGMDYVILENDDKLRVTT